jgi:hypothetical protein
VVHGLDAENQHDGDRDQRDRAATNAKVLVVTQPGVERCEYVADSAVLVVDLR